MRFTVTELFIICLLTMFSIPAQSQSYVRTYGGTSDTIPKFNSSTYIGDSIITDDGSTVEIDGEFVCDGLKTDSYGSLSTNVTSGSSLNYICAISSTCEGNVIAGGGSGSSSTYRNTIGSSEFAVIGGGYDNEIWDGNYTTLAGGICNIILGDDYATVSGGYSQASDGIANTISGGYDNTTSANYSTVGGGFDNGVYYATYGTVSGGYSNLVTSGTAATIPGGYNNAAAGNYSWAGGAGAVADENYTFVWSGAGGSCNSSVAYQFRVCASGGAYFSHNVSAWSFTDRTPYPKDLDTAYDAVMSMQRLPDGQYNPNDTGSQLDHSSLTDFVYSDAPEGEEGRNLSATVSAQNEVIKDLVHRITELEAQVSGDSVK